MTGVQTCALPICLVDHVDYIVDLAGIDHVGCGFDFEDYVQSDSLIKNGVDNNDTSGIEGLQSAADCQNFLEELKRRGYSDEDIEKVAYKNFYRVYRQVLT